MKSRFACRLLGATALLLWLASAPVAAQPPVSVTGAVPAEGEQDTVGLLVKVTGKNFGQGARTDFFRSGTSDPAGVTVRSSRVVSSGEIEATVDIAPGAALSKFDIRVTNTNGRSGKGSDLFTVVEKGTGNQGCLIAPLPPNVALVQRLNGVDGSGQPLYRGALGAGISAKEVTIKGQATLLLAAPAAPGIEVFFLTEGPGGVANVDVINPHRRLTAASMPAMFPTAVGDFNGDGAPDILAGNHNIGRAVVFLGSWDGSGNLGFGAALPVPPPSTINYYSDDVAVGDLDAAWPGDEIAIGQWGGGTGKQKFPGRVYLYRVSGTSVVPLPQATVVPTLSPSLGMDEFYGQTLTIADVTGSADADLIVSATGRASAGGGTGHVFVFPGPTFDTDTAAGLQPFTIRAHTPRDKFGFGLGTGDVNNDGTRDVAINTFYNVNVVAADAALGPIGPAHVTAAGFAIEQPQSDANMGFGTTGSAIGDLDGDGLADMAIGAPDSTTRGSCIKQGTVFVWRGTGNPGAAWHAPVAIQAPELDPYIAHFGWRLLIERVGALRFLIVGERERDLGGVEDAGQIYLYRVSTP
jgi:hypothetical protein